MPVLQRGTGALRFDRGLGDWGFAVKDPDPVSNPAHYTTHPSGVECIQITEHMGFNLGNVVKYVWRADLKGNGDEDLAKAAWYIQREIERRRTTK
jgi:hypothetical protein